MKRRLTVVLLVLFTAIFAVSCDILLPDEGATATSGEALSTAAETTVPETSDGITESDSEGAKTTEVFVESVESEEITEAATSAPETESVTESESETECAHGSFEEKQVVAPTCQNGGILHVVCSDCGEILMVGEEEPLAHTEGKWIIERTPTLERKGLKTTNCTVCDEKLKESIEKVGYAEGLGFIPNGDGTCSLESIGNCKEIFVFVPPTSPDGDVVVSVGEGAFSDFYTDYDIVSLNLPDTVEIIGNSAFEGLTKLKELTLPKGLKVIGDFAFGSCFSLENVTIPEGVTDIGFSAFANCRGIKKWNIPASVERIGRAAFFPEKVTAITVDPENQNFYVEGNCLISSDGVLIVGYGDVSVPDGVKIIGKEAFAYNNKISKIILPESVESIEFLAFYNCSVTEIVIPEGVTKLFDSFCSFCDELRSVTIPKSVTEIERWAIEDCAKLTEIKYTGSLYDWKRVKIHSDNELILSIDITYMATAPTDNVRNYGRTTISGNAAYVYDRMVEEIISDAPAENIELDRSRKITLDDVSLARLIFMSDYPQCFWWSGVMYYTYNDEGVVYAIKPQYKYAWPELAKMRAELDAKVAEIVSTVPEGTVFDKALYLHDALASRVHYEVTENDQTPYGALVEGLAVCNGYATSYQLLLMECGIRAWTVNGDADGTPHAWNVVWMDDETCVYTDVTWDDQEDKSGEIMRYYFNMSLDEIDDNHTANTLFTLPECNHTEESYTDVSTDYNLLREEDGAEVIVSFFEEDGEYMKRAHFFFEGESIENWLEGNAADIYRLLDAKGMTYYMTGNEVVVTVVLNETVNE